MKNRNSIYAEAYARKILGLTLKDVSNLKNNNKTRHPKKPINKHGNYDGTDAGFTSTSIQMPNKKCQISGEKKPAKPDGNYDGTDVGFTANFKK
jgi:hypothetical protein